MVAEGQPSDEMKYDMDVLMKKRCGTESLHGEKMSPLPLSNACWTSMETKQWGVSGAFQQWWQQVTSAGAGFYKCSMQALANQWWKCIANGGIFYVKKQCYVAENLLYQIVPMCSLYLL